jgi:hypothetical protein
VPILEYARTLFGSEKKEAKKVEQPRKSRLSRRDFLKGILVGTAAVGAELIGLTRVRAHDDDQLDVPVEEGEKRESKEFAPKYADLFIQVSEALQELKKGNKESVFKLLETDILKKWNVPSHVAVKMSFSVNEQDSTEKDIQEGESTQTHSVNFQNYVTALWDVDGQLQVRDTRAFMGSLLGDAPPVRTDLIEDKESLKLFLTQLTAEEIASLKVDFSFEDEGMEGSVDAEANASYQELGKDLLVALPASEKSAISHPVLAPFSDQVVTQETLQRIWTNVNSRGWSADESHFDKPQPTAVVYSVSITGDGVFIRHQTSSYGNYELGSLRRARLAMAPLEAIFEEHDRLRQASPTASYPEIARLAVYNLAIVAERADLVVKTKLKPGETEWEQQTQLLIYEPGADNHGTPTSLRDVYSEPLQLSEELRQQVYAATIDWTP